MNNTRGSSPAMNVLAIVGFVAVIIIGIWGAVNAFRLTPQMFSNIASFFSRVDDTIEITIPDSGVRSGTAFNVTWDHDGDESGHYVFSYRCRPNFSFQIAQEDGTYAPTACESPTKIPTQNEQRLRVVPASQAQFLDVPFVIAYIDNEGEVAAEGTQTITITNRAGSDDAGLPETDDTPDTGAGDDDSGDTAQKHPDLTARILEIGIIHPTTGAFVPQQVISRHDTGAVRFEVKNAGTAASGTWAFTAQLPTNPPYQYDSKRQQSLNPQDRIEYTIQFDRLQAGSGTFSLRVDPANEVRESSESNNTLSHTIVVQ